MRRHGPIKSDKSVLEPLNLWPVYLDLCPSAAFNSAIRFLGLKLHPDPAYAIYAAQCHLGQFCGVNCCGDGNCNCCNLGGGCITDSGYPSYFAGFASCLGGGYIRYCVKCSPGTYSGQSSATSLSACKPCPTGTYSAAGDRNLHEYLRSTLPACPHLHP